AGRSLSMQIQPRTGPPVKMVALGDSLTQGTQDATTIEDREQHSYMKQMADQAGLTFNQAYFDGEGLPFSTFHNHSFDLDHFLKHVLKLGLATAPLGIHAYFIGPPPIVLPTWETVPHMGHRTAESKNTPEHPQQNFAVCGYILSDLYSTANV